MSRFATLTLPPERTVVATDGSDVRVLLGLAGGGLAHFSLAAGATSRAVTHRTVEEIWYVLSGRGEMWRRQGLREEVVDLVPGACVSIPLGTHFQLRASSTSALAVVAVTMPPWPGDGEASPVEGPWAARPEASPEGRTHTSIRAMSIDDYDAVHALWAGTPGVGLSESDTRAATDAFLRRSPGMSAVACVGAERIGAVLCGHDGRRGYLHHLAVSTAWRGRGIARQLVAHCFEQLAAAGIPKCNIFLYADNAEGAAFWEHDGWSARSDLRVLQKPVPPPARRPGG